MASHRQCENRNHRVASTGNIKDLPHHRRRVQLSIRAPTRRFPFSPRVTAMNSRSSERRSCLSSSSDNCDKSSVRFSCGCGKLLAIRTDRGGATISRETPALGVDQNRNSPPPCLPDHRLTDLLRSAFPSHNRRGRQRHNHRVRKRMTQQLPVVIIRECRSRLDVERIIC